MKYLSLLFVAVLIFSSCHRADESKKSKPLAKVFDKYLYPEDLKGVLPAGVSGNDSASLVKDFVEKWVRNQLLLNKAEMNLTDKEKDVQQQIENYRSSLLIYTYQQRYIQQNLDTVVSDQEIEHYYNDNQSNFVLSESMMKGVFIKVPVQAPDIYKLRQWYRSDDTESMKNLEGYCFKNAAVYDHFNEGWVNINEVIRMVPVASGGSYLSALQSRKYIETRDNAYYYFIYAKEIASEGTVSPFDLVKNDIHYIILNKRKIKLINELESSIYTDAQNRDHFTIYNP